MNTVQFSYFEIKFHSCCLGWSTMVHSRLTTASASWGQVILLPQPPKLQVPMLIFVYLVESEFYHIDQAGLELLTSGNRPPRPPKVLSRHAQPKDFISLLMIPLT